jgi:ligand-binding sensor domain-containing protein
VRVGRERWWVTAATAVGIASAPMACDGVTGPTLSEFELVEAFRLDQLEPDDFILTMAASSNGHLWIGTFQGLVLEVWEGGVLDHSEAATSGSSTPIYDIFVGPGDRIWASDGEGYAVLERGDWSWNPTPSYASFPTLVRSVAVNPAGEVLLGVGNANGGGLLLFSDDSWSPITPANSRLPSSIVADIDVGPDGDFWVGTLGFQGRGGVARISRGQVVLSLDGPGDGLLYPSVDRIQVGDDGAWLGYGIGFIDQLGVPDGGLQLLSEPTEVLSSHFPFETGLTSNRIVAMHLAVDGTLWFTTGLDEDLAGCERCLAGIGRLGPAGDFTALSALNYDLPPNGFFPAITEAPDGRIFVAHDRRVLRIVD